MKTFCYFIITLLISAGFLLGAMNTPNPFPLFTVAFGIWVIFIWRYTVRTKKQAAKRAREQLFEQYMRSRTRQ
ncbi:hypothetical protein HDF24_00385 [Mucilaginibacter sp. X4EP1]|uniref:hypothetical protein n=1 Tax=Mucilaginibacter sp. X4EP1 TaxID=2723092 RepID=UPI00216A6F5C|nr:hypothetical protein [Mucilaginibacter sp. X4EP1]MCS3811466.1 putative membrane protein [Mucilaginibacter sp. X4EP1]